jgi:hypothetical protein
MLPKPFQHKVFLLPVFLLFLGFIQTKSYAQSIQSGLDEPKGHFFPANFKDIRYTGRIDFTDSLKPKFWTPGVYIEARFTGSFCDVIVDDEVRGGENFNYLEIVVDGILQKRIQTRGKHNVIRAVENLPDGEHTLLICKDTETNIGYIEFIGLQCKGLVSLLPKPSRKIEFIGNSITCGTGSDQSQVKCGKGKWHDQHNAYMAYGPLVSRYFKAQWMLSSYSGIGLIHSCCGIQFTMPEVFDRINFTPNNSAWEFSRYIPDVVTICLGQNDGIQDSSKFCMAYVSFIQQLRRHYPQTEFICLTSPMGNAELTAVLKKYLSSVVGYLNESGDDHVHTYFFTRSYNNGCDTHPDLDEHKLIAAELESYIGKLMNW